MRQVLGTTNWGKKDYKYGQLKGFQIEAKRLQIRAGILNKGKTDYKSRQGLQLGVEHRVYLCDN